MQVSTFNKLQKVHAVPKLNMIIFNVSITDFPWIVDMLLGNGKSLVKLFNYLIDQLLNIVLLYVLD